MKKIMQTVKQNKYLIISCMILTYGIIIGTFLIKFIPENLCEKIFALIANNHPSLKTKFFDLFIMSFSVLTLEFIFGMNLCGNLINNVILFFNGIVLGICKSINFYYLGTNFILDSAIEYFTYTVFVEFVIILMAESALKFSKQLLIEINQNGEKNSIKFKNYIVKYITFTCIIIIFSFLSAYISYIFL